MVSHVNRGKKGNGERGLDELYMKLVTSFTLQINIYS
jgi:hypothetical protein